MVETIYGGSERRYVVANKGKIIVVTYSRKYADYLDYVLRKNDYDASYHLKVMRK